MTNPTPEAIEALVKRIKTELAFLRGEDALNGLHFGNRPDGEGAFWWRKHLTGISQAADLLTALSQRAPDPTGGWCNDMEAAPRDGTRILVWASGRADIAYYAKSILDGPLWQLRREGFCSDRWSPQPTAWQRITPPVRGQEKGGA